MGSQIELTISIVMIVLFSIAIFGFAINFANDNDAEMSISSDPTVSSTYDMHKGNASTFSSETESTYTSILDTTVQAGSDITPSAAPFAPTRGSLVNSLKNIVMLPKNAIFGGSGSPFGIFFTVLISVVTLLFVLYLIKTWRGNP